MKRHFCWQEGPERKNLYKVIIYYKKKKNHQISVLQKWKYLNTNPVKRLTVCQIPKPALQYYSTPAVLPLSASLIAAIVIPSDPCVYITLLDPQPTESFICSPSSHRELRYKNVNYQTENIQPVKSELGALPALQSAMS